MKNLFQNWGERIRTLASQLGERFRNARARRSPGFAAIPGQSTTQAGGKLSFLKGGAFPKVDWEKLYRKSFVYNSVAAVICGYFVADLLVASMTPWFPPAQAPRPRLNLASDRKDFFAYANVILPKGRPNLFNEKGLVPDNDEGGGGDMNGPPVKTSLPLNLLGVIVVQDPKKSVASIEDKTANQVVAVRIGEPITRDTVVQEITDEKVIFLNNATGRREFVDLPQDQITATRRAAPTRAGGGGIQKTDDTHYHIDRKEVDKAMENLNTILTDARCVPEFEGGRPAGYRCFQITPGSVYDKLGLKDNDVICGLNGESVNDPAKAFQVLSSLKDPSTRNIQICIKRGGQISNYSYDIQ